MTDELPAPLVPPEVDLRGYEFMPYYGDRLRESDLNSRATDAEYRAAHNLWWSAWKQVPAASVPDDDVTLARLADLGRDLRAWAKVRNVALRGFAKCSDGRLYHQVLAPLAVEAWEFRNRQRNRTAAAREAALSQRQSQKPPQPQKTSVTESTGQDRTGQRQDRESKASTRARKTPIQPDFKISQRLEAWALEKGFDRLPEHLEAFRSKCLAKGYEYIDWDAALMEAIREDWAGLRRSNGSGGQSANKQESLEQRNLRVAANWKPPEEEHTNPSTAATAAQTKE